MLQGSIVALVTPFKNNDIDYDALWNLIEFHMENGTDGILLCGTTAETPTLTDQEKNELISFAIEKINKRKPVIIGSGTNNLEKTIKMTQEAEKSGADYALVITPYYNKPTQMGMYHYFKKISEEVNIPIIIYNVPGRTGVNIVAETVIKLADECDNIVGIKDASGDLVQVSEIVKKTSDDFFVLSGEDALNLPYISCGARGAISVTANIVPKQMHDLVINALNFENEIALKIHQDLIDLNKAMFFETNPIPVKAALNLMGKVEDEIRLPLYKISEENLKKLKQVLLDSDLIG